jgi:hypothetical protein
MLVWRAASAALFACLGDLPSTLNGDTRFADPMNLP